MPELEKTVLEGSPHDRGLIHGEKHADGIRNNVDFYYEYFGEHGLSDDASRDIAKDVIRLIEEKNPEYLSEMCGVADGSGIPIEEVAMVNFRHTIIFSAYGAEISGSNDVDFDSQSRFAEGCTSIGVQPERTLNGHTFIGQNWDWKPPVDIFLMEVRREDEPNFLALTESGNVCGKFGFNESGIGFAVNGLSTPEDGRDPTRKPSHVRGREILDSDRLDQAFEAVISTPRPTSRNYMIAHANGELIDIETTPDSFDFLYPEQHVITHANHFEKRCGIKSQLEQQLPHSIVRGMRARRLFDQANDSITFDVIKSIFRDDFGKPRSIARHAIENNGIEESHTKASIIMNLNEQKLLATYGPPDINEYHTYELSS